MRVSHHEGMEPLSELQVQRSKWQADAYFARQMVQAWAKLIPDVAVLHRDWCVTSLETWNHQERVCICYVHRFTLDSRCTRCMPHLATPRTPRTPSPAPGTHHPPPTPGWMTRRGS